MSSESSDSDCPLTKKKKYINKQKVFQNKWLEEPLFKRWLQPLKNNNLKCRCTVCNVEIQCGKSEINKHAKGIKHKKMINIIDSNKPISSFIAKETSITKSIKTAEIGLAAFFAEHNVAFATADHLIPLLKKIAPDSNILNGVQMGRTKCTEVVKSVLAKKETDDLIIILRNNFFSLLLDESTDVSDKKNLCVLARYIRNAKVTTSLLQLIELDGKDCTADKLFSAVRNCLDRNLIPIQNIVGVASDGAAVMVGKNNSFFSRMKDAVPHVVLLKCICHSSALIAAKACEELPRSPEDLIRNIGTYVSGSSKRCAILLEFQEYFNSEKRKILKVSSTRWLSMYKCVKRILENWDVLLHFFSLAVAEDHLKMASIILEAMNNPLNKGYLLFLLYSLNYFNSFNALFQSRAVLINELHSKSLTIFWQFTQNFVKPELVHKCYRTPIRQPQNYIELDKIGLGFTCNEFIKKFPADLQKEFKLKCLNFYITAGEGIQKRMPLNDGFFKQLNILTPAVVLDLANRDLHTNFSDVITQYKNLIDIEKLEYQWRILPFSFTESKLTELKLLDLENFWLEIEGSLDENNSSKFPDLIKLIHILLVLPHSNAEAERIFSIVTDCKPNKRNRLGNTALNAMAVFRSALQSRAEHCNTFSIEDQHIALLNNSIYTFKD